MDGYVELEISLDRYGSGPYIVEYEIAQPGKAAVTRQSQKEQATVEFDLAALRALQSCPEAYGQALTASLFAPQEIRMAFTQALGQAQAQRVALRLQLYLKAGARELHGLLWETLRNPQDGSALGADENIWFSRFLTGKDSRLPDLPTKGRLRALAMAAGPADLERWGLAPVDVEGELQRARQSLGEAQVWTLPEAGSGRRASLDDLVASLRLMGREGGCHVLYLACHGGMVSGQPVVWLEDEHGRTKPVQGEQLATRLQELTRLPLLVVLASCESAKEGGAQALAALGPRLAEAGVPAVLAMQGKITMETVEKMMPVFFQELAWDGQVDRALAVGRGAVGGRPDWWAPVLFTRLKSGRIFREEEARREGQRGLFTIEPPPVDFVGREKELAELRKAFEGGAGRRGATISGLSGGAGVGKTALARMLAHSLAGSFPDARLEIDLQGVPKEGQAPLSPAEALRRLLAPFFPPDARLPDEESELRGLFVDALRRRRALLLLDNAKDAAQVRPLLPPAPSAAIVASRAHIVLSAEGLRPLRLEALPLGEAVSLLRQVAPRLREEADEAVERLAEACGRLPLALRCAASLLEARLGWTLAGYLERLADERGKLAALRDPHDPDLDVEAALEVSYRALDEALQARLRALGVFPAPFTQDAAAAVWGGGDEAAGEALEELVYLGLAERQAGAYRLHDLTRAFALSRLCEKQDEARQAGERHADYYLEVGGRADDLYMQGGAGVLEGLALFREAWPHLQAAWRRMAGEEEWPRPQGAERWLCDFPDRTAYVLDLHVSARERIRLLERAAGAARAVQDRQAEGNRLGNLGLAYAALGEPRRAIEYYEQALAISREIGDRRGEGADLGNLGNAYAALGEPRRAIEYYEQALAIAREIGDRRGEGARLGNLGNAYADLGEPRRAIEYYEQALAISREIGDRRGEGNHLGNLGSAYRDLGEPRRAIEYYQQQLVITREIGDRRGEANACWNLGLLYEQQGDYPRAAELMQVCVDFERAIGHPDAEADARRVEEVRRKTGKR